MRNLHKRQMFFAKYGKLGELGELDELEAKPHPAHLLKGAR